MPMHLVIPAPQVGRSFLPEAMGRVPAVSGIGAVPRITEDAPARRSADSAITRSVELSLGRSQDEGLYDRRGQLETPASTLPAALARAGTEGLADARPDIRPAASPNARPDAPGIPGSTRSPGTDAGAGPDTEATGVDAAEAGDPGRPDPAAEPPEPPPALDVNAVLAALASTGMAVNRGADGVAGVRGGEAEGQARAPAGAVDRPGPDPVVQGRREGAGTVDAKAPDDAVLAPAPAARPAVAVAVVNGAAAPAAAERSERVERADRAGPAPAPASRVGDEATVGDAAGRPAIAAPRLPGSGPQAAAADGPPRTRVVERTLSAVDARVDAEAEVAVVQAAEETGRRVSGELQNAQLVAMAERNRQLLVATYLPEPALPSDPVKAADDVRPSDVDQPWR